MEPLCSLSTNNVLFGTPIRVQMPMVTEARTPTRNENTEIRSESPTTYKRNIEETNEKPKRKLTAVDKLIKKLPKIDDYFNVHKKIGEGAFSNVFLATCKASEQKKFAIKHLTPTSHPNRVIQEMKCLRNIGGQDNVVKLEFCLRERDAVAFIMPYFPHDSFSQYVTQMDVTEMQLYMMNLLIALRRVHSFEIIHRDVKPTNFLYNRRERRFLLVDFGLAHRVDNSHTVGCSKISRKRTIDEVDPEATSASEPKRPVLHSLSGNVLDNGDRAKLSLKKKSPPYKENSPVVNSITINRNINQVKRNLQFGNVTAETKKEIEPLLGRSIFNECQNFSANVSASTFRLVPNSQINSKVFTDQVPFRKPVPKTRFGSNDACGCDKKPRICNSCVRRKGMHAPRAGTPGYRSPEVLLKYSHQTTAVDVWSAGVIMLSIMSGSYPFFHAPDDISALMEMITVFGTSELRHTATKLGRHLLTNEQRKPLKLNKLCETLRRRSSDESAKKETSVAADFDEKPKQKKASAETASTVEDSRAAPEKRATKIGSCRYCLQKVVLNEGCLCSDYAKKKGDSNDEGRVHQSVEPLFPKEAYDLLAKLLTVDPDKRITADLALRHPFFSMNFSSS